MIYFKVLVLNLIIVLLLPVILLQALWVRKKTAVLPEPDGERVLTSADSKLLLTNNILVIGDSAAAGVGATTQMGALTGLLYSNLVKHGPTRVTLNAKTGFKSEDVLKLLHEMPAEHFSSVLVSIGVNDVTKFVPLKRWRQNIDAMSTLLSDKFGCETILFTRGGEGMRARSLLRPLLQNTISMVTFEHFNYKFITFFRPFGTPLKVPPGI